MNEDEAMRRLNASLERDEWRHTRAVEIARERFLGDDDVEICAPEGTMPVESVDGGYWVEARVWVDADMVGDPIDAEITADANAIGVNHHDEIVDEKERALAVLILSSETRQWLADHDPKALEQARAALGLTTKEEVASG